MSDDPGQLWTRIVCDLLIIGMWPDYHVLSLDCKSFFWLEMTWIVIGREVTKATIVHSLMVLHGSSMGLHRMWSANYRVVISIIHVLSPECESNLWLEMMSVVFGCEVTMITNVNSLVVLLGSSMGVDRMWFPDYRAVTSIIHVLSLDCESVFWLEMISVVIGREATMITIVNSLVVLLGSSMGLDRMWSSGYRDVDSIIHILSLDCGSVFWLELLSTVIGREITITTIAQSLVVLPGWSMGLDRM